MAQEGDAGPSGASLLPSGALESSSLSKGSREERATTAPPNPAQSGEDLSEPGLQGTAPSAALSTALPEEAATKRALPSGKRLPSLKQVNSARKQLRPKATSAAAVQRALSQPASSGPGLLSSATEKPRPPGDPEPAASEEPLWLDRKAGADPTTPAPLQISPFTSRPYVAHTLPQKPDPGEPSVPDDPHEAPPEDASPMTLVDKGESELTGSASEESQETTTSTIITTTVITTEQAPGKQPPDAPALLRQPGGTHWVQSRGGGGGRRAREVQAPPSVAINGALTVSLTLWLGINVPILKMRRQGRLGGSVG